jgi:hypothetical protein
MASSRASAETAAAKNSPNRRTKNLFIVMDRDKSEKVKYESRGGIEGGRPDPVGICAGLETCRRVKVTGRLKKGERERKAELWR